MIVKKGSERVPRGTLNRERTVTAALELLDEEGLDALSMPRLAHRLGVGTMSLYSHLEGKDDLLDAVVNRVFETVIPPSGHRGDVGRVVDNFREFRRVALEHPAVGRLLVDRLTRTSTVLRNLEVSLGILTRRWVRGGRRGSPLLHPVSLHPRGGLVGPRLAAQASMPQLGRRSFGVFRRRATRLYSTTPGTWPALPPRSSSSGGSLLSPAVRAVRYLKPARSMPNLSSAPARSIASSDLDLGSHDDGALGREGESVARVGGIVGE